MAEHSGQDYDTIARIVITLWLHKQQKNMA